MSRVLVLGNATLDVIQSVERLPRPGETMLSSRLLRCPGGKGLNQAVAAARTGARVSLAAPVGQDAEAALLAHGLGREAGLEVAWRITDAATDMSSIWVSGDGENMIVSTAAAAWSIAPDHARSICADLTAADILLMQGNLRADTTMAAAGTARRRGARTVLNTAPISWDMQPAVGLFDIVIANEGEAAALAGGDLAAFWPRLRSRGVLMAVVTLGARGARIFGADEDITVPAPRVQHRRRWGRDGGDDGGIAGNGQGQAYSRHDRGGCRVALGHSARHHPVISYPCRNMGFRHAGPASADIPKRTVTLYSR